MIFSLIKFIFFASIILLIGQVAIQNETIAERFSRQFRVVWSWGGNELARTNAFRAMPSLSKWIPTGKTNGKREHLPAARKETEPEKITASDRESILHLLE